MGWKRVAISSGNDPWAQTQGNSFAEELERHGGIVVVKIELNPKTADVGPEALKIAGSQPDAVFYADTFTMCARALTSAPEWQLYARAHYG